MRIESNRSDQSQRTDDHHDARDASKASTAARSTSSEKAERNLASAIRALCDSRSPTLASSTGASSGIPWTVPTSCAQAPAGSAGADTTAAAPPTVQQQVDSAIARVEAQAESGRRLLHQVNAANRKIPNISRAATAVVAGVNITGIPGNLATGVMLHGLGHPTVGVETLNDARSTVEMMGGKLNREAAEAGTLYRKFLREYGEYQQASQQLRAAMAGGDHRAIVDLSRRGSQLDQEMRKTAREFESKAEEVDRLNKEFDAAAKHAAVHAAISAVTAGIGGVPGEHAVTGLAGKVAGKLYGAAVESGVGRATSFVSHALHGAIAPEQKAVGVTGRATDAMRDSR